MTRSVGLKFFDASRSARRSRKEGHISYSSRFSFRWKLQRIGTYVRMSSLITCFCTLISVGNIVAQQRTETNVVYGMYSGLALLMDVYYPEKPNGYGVIHVTGTGWHDPLGYSAVPQKASDQVKIFGLPLVNAGYTLFALNHRAAPLFHHPAAVEDVQRAVRFIRYHAKRFGINPNAVGGVGGSSGGHLIAMAGVLDGRGDADDADPVNRESAKLQCVLVRAAPVDLIRMNAGLAGNAAIASFLGIRLSSTAPKTSTEYKTYWDASPINHVSSDDPPFLMIHGDADESVPFLEAETMQEALRRVGVAAQIIRIPGGRHGPTFPGATEQPNFVGEMVRWLGKHLRKER